jgi:dinuclear metal center YbgI/SA1388 family protein
MASVGDVVERLDKWYPPGWAEPWDNPGLQVGDRQAPVTQVLAALDPTAEVLTEASGRGCELVVTHHPLVFEPLPDMDLARPDARAVASAIRAGVAVVACHTNADVARPGVSDALAAALDLEVTGPLAVGPSPDGFGLGRVAGCSPTDVAEIAQRCSAALGGPARIVGDPVRAVRTVALCGGSGSTLIDDAVRLGADVFVTADVKHHAALDALAKGLAVIDAGHFQTEWPWVPHVAGRLSAAFPGTEVLVSGINTDPFTGARG